jgi:hypothetical protein
MSPNCVLHFLLTYDIRAAKADLVPFGTDYEAALDAYDRTEAEHREDPNTEVVLLGSDSVETIERTHSNYFELSERHIDRIVARELAEFGLR